MGVPFGDAFPVCPAPKLRTCQDLPRAPKHRGGWSLVLLVFSLTSRLPRQLHRSVGGFSKTLAAEVTGREDAEPSATRHQKAQFSRPCHNFICVESNYLKNVKQQRDFFFLLLIPLHLSFASVKREQCTAAHKSEDVCCIPHESCKCRVMSHILVKRTRKQTVLLSELSLDRGRREKAESFFGVRISKETLNSCSFCT